MKVRQEVSCTMVWDPLMRRASAVVASCYACSTYGVGLTLLGGSGKPVLALLESRKGDKYYRPLLGASLAALHLQRHDPHPDLRRTAPAAGARVRHEDPEQSLDDVMNLIIECRFEASDSAWVVMHVRTDKTEPNAWHVYEKVLRSIQDNIQEDYLLGQIAQAMEGDMYAEDRRRQ